MKKYNEVMKEIRKKRGKKQAEIAEILDTAQTIYSRYERGERELPLQHLITLADYYEVSTDYLLGRTNKQEPYPSIEESCN